MSETVGINDRSAQALEYPRDLGLTGANASCKSDERFRLFGLRSRQFPVSRACLEKPDVMPTGHTGPTRTAEKTYTTARDQVAPGHALPETDTPQERGKEKTKSTRRKNRLKQDGYS